MNKNKMVKELSEIFLSYVLKNNRYIDVHRKNNIFLNNFKILLQFYLRLCYNVRQESFV